MLNEELMKICEIFYSIQGEGQWTGRPNVFIRTQGCNLRCSYCDTTYAYDEGKEWSILDIIKKVEGYSCQLVCITGGEPLIQKNLMELVKTLISKEYILCVETNGSQKIDDFVHLKSLLISLDVKCPSSGMSSSMDWTNLKKIRSTDQIKFIIGNLEDYEYAKSVVLKHNLECFIYFQPVWQQLSPRDLASWIIEDKLKVTLGLQIHKILFGNRRKT